MMPLLRGALQRVRPSLCCPSRSYNAQQRSLVEALELDGRLNFVAGERRMGGGQALENVYPATGVPLLTFHEASASDIDDAVTAATAAAAEWRLTPLPARCRLLREVASSIRALLDPLSSAETLDVGKPLWECRADIANCADVFDFYAGLGPLLSGVHCPLDDLRSAWYSRREPLGVCAAIGAWNFPFQMAAFKTAPALLCGNAVVFKPSELTPTSAEALARLVSRAGAPRGLVSVLQGGAAVGDALVRHPGVRKVSFTGSAAAGAAVMRRAAERTLPVSLELGGKSAMVVCADADVEEAVKGALLANFLSQGQVCSNAARVFVHSSLAASFTAQLLAMLPRLRLGDPFAPDTAIGALISLQHAQRVSGFVQRARDAGATVLAGGERRELAAPLHGFFLPPTVLAGCADEAEVVREEVFGPVMTLLPFEEEEEALRRANDTEMQLAGGIFTRDVGRAMRMAAELSAGSLYVNNYNILPPGLPFGGFRRSGMGRENAAEETLAAYTQVKSVYVEGGRIELPFPLADE